ncbi:MAG: polyhydroxybutyrate depolymerase [Pseudomonadota bacterium]
MIRVILALCLLVAAPVRAQESCQMLDPCLLGDRSYHARLPDGWDGVSPLPVMLHFHGWQRQGTLVVQHRRIATATTARGVLLLAPNGQRRTWDFYSGATPDVGFARAVLDDAARRWPVDRSRIYVSGYSFGAAMAWRFVCEDGADVAALLAVSGTLRGDTICPTAPGEVRHVHGTTDTVMRFPFGPGGDVTGPVALWRQRLGCAAGGPTGPYQAREWLTFERHEWADCDGGARVILDVHGSGHFIPHGWFAHQLDDLLAAGS